MDVESTQATRSAMSMTVNADDESVDEFSVSMASLALNSNPATVVHDVMMPDQDDASSSPLYKEQFGALYDKVGLSVAGTAQEHTTDEKKHEKAAKLPPVTARSELTSPAKATSSPKKKRAAKVTPSPKKKKAAKVTLTPNSCDIVFGDSYSVKTTDQTGTREFYDLAEEYKPYCSSTAIDQVIVDLLGDHRITPRRFLLRENQSTCWVELPNDRKNEICRMTLMLREGCFNTWREEINKSLG
jgi:hypothetical protein